MHPTHVKNFGGLLAVCVLAIVLGAAFLFTETSEQVSETPTPTQTTNTDQVTPVTKDGLTFAYPKSLGTTYIRAVEWPPQLQKQSTRFSCVESGTAITPEGKTTLKTIEGNTYCVTESSEGAAGSTFITYRYLADFSDFSVAVSFTLQEVQCLNYDEPKQSECTAERAAFTPDTVVSEIIRSVRVDE